MFTALLYLSKDGGIAKLLVCSSLYAFFLRSIANRTREKAIDTGAELSTCDG